MPKGESAAPAWACASGALSTAKNPAATAPRNGFRRSTRTAPSATRIGSSYPRFAAVSASLPTMSRLAVILIPMLASALAFPARAASLEARVHDSAGKPVADAVVYAMPAAGGVDARAGKTAAIEQIDREFVPYVSVIQSGTTVIFPNRDPILHHVYSFSPPKPFEIKLYSGMPPRGELFDKPGVVAL